MIQYPWVCREKKVKLEDCLKIIKRTWYLEKGGGWIWVMLVRIVRGGYNKNTMYTCEKVSKINEFQIFDRAQHLICLVPCFPMTRDILLVTQSSFFHWSVQVFYLFVIHLWRGPCVFGYFFILWDYRLARPTWCKGMRKAHISVEYLLLRWSNDPRLLRSSIGDIGCHRHLIVRGWVHLLNIGDIPEACFIVYTSWR